MDSNEHDNAESPASGSGEETEEVGQASIFENSDDPNGPRKNDVLLGRGKPYQNFSGNRRMLRIVTRYRGEYAAKPRDQKRLYVETALEAVLKDGTRFLKKVDLPDGTCKWEEVDRAAASEKVWHVLRSKGEGRARKARRGSEQEGDQAQSGGQYNDGNPPTGAGTGGEQPAAGAVYYQQPPGMSAPMSIQHISLIQSLSTMLLQHLSNASAAAAMLAAITAGTIQLPPRPPTSAGAGARAAPSSQGDGQAQVTAQHLLEHLLAQAQGAALNQAGGRAQHPQPFPSANGLSRQPDIAAMAFGNLPAAAAAMPPMPQAPQVNQVSASPQTQLMQVISSLMRVAEQWNHPNNQQQPPPQNQQQPPT